LGHIQKNVQKVKYSHAFLVGRLHLELLREYKSKHFLFTLEPVFVSLQ